MLAAQPGGEGQFLGRGGAAHLVEEGAALGAEQGVEAEVVHGAIVGQSVDGVRPAAVSARRGPRRLQGSDTMRLVRQNDQKRANSLPALASGCIDAARRWTARPEDHL
ncbi:hypothetical protein GCM10010448_13690 [Streptomyces glomeratus]|uniref:Uncharacterized protein n=1 Tax=Streptomyces glomeratus TaxID=284452 RepID=A0ABP6L595_9ACTN